MRREPKLKRSQIAPEGWLIDPSNPAAERFWSGQQWLDFVRDPHNPGRLLKRPCRKDTPPPLIENMWRKLLVKLVIPGVCAITAGAILAGVIASQTPDPPRAHSTVTVTPTPKGNPR